MEASTPTPPPASTPDDGYQKKFKVAAALAVIFGIAAIGLGFWGYSQKSDLDDANEKLSKVEATDTASIDELKSKYDSVKQSLSNRDVEVEDLEAEIKKQSAELEQAKTNTANAESEEEREQAEVEELQKRASLAATCAQGAVSAIGKLIDEQAAGTGTSGTIDKLSSLREECSAALGG